MDKWLNKFKKCNIFFLAPDVKRGLGLEDILPNYHIICSYFDPIIPIVRQQGGKIFCLEEIDPINAQEINNSGKLLEHKQVIDYIKRHSIDTPWIMYFKPSIKLDLLIEKYSFLSLGNTAQQNEFFENKINFFRVCQKKLAKYLIPSEIGIFEQMNFSSLVKKLKLPLVVQFGHGWAGKTTFIIKNENNFIKLRDKYKKTKIKVSSYIDGITVLNNCCRYRKKILISPCAVQINGIASLYPKESVTCGRQWPVKFLDKKQIKTINKISQSLGDLLIDKNFRGFFGVDFIIDKKSGRVFISEMNARLTASAPFYTRLERGKGLLPLLAYHLASFLQISIPINDNRQTDIFGSQIIFRTKLSKKLDRLFDYGVYKKKKNRLYFLRSDYYPEKLADGEFILIKRNKKMPPKNEEELARIETKKEVLENPSRLEFWINDLIRS